MRIASGAAVAIVVVMLASRQRERAPAGPIASLDTMMVSPAGATSGEPSLVADAAGVVWLSWLEAVGDSSHALRVSRLDGGHWSEPRLVASGPRLMVNWADFPSIAVSRGGRLVAHWLERSDTGRYAYDIRMAESRDAGATWSAPVTPHRDGLPAEHGFVSMWPAAGDSIALVWLDGRKSAMPDSAHEMTVAYTTVGPEGGLGAEQVLDARTCDCCQTTAAMTSRGPIVAYRDRTADEIRDISVTRLVGGAWTAPTSVHADGWKIDACPVNGPRLVARGDTVAIAWFTAARDTARVNVAFSTDAGASFGAPVRVDDGQPSGRVDIALDHAGRALVTWIERRGANPAPAVPAPRTGGGTAQIAMRAVTMDGATSAISVIGASTGGRSSGFPRMVASGDGLVLAWTEPGTPARVRVARATVAP